MKIKTSKFFLLVSLVAVLSSTVGCGNKTEEVAGSGPVDRFEKRKHWVSVYAKANAKHSELFTVARLAAFSPGFSIADALTVYGEPQTRIPEKGGAEYLVYESDFGIIRLGAESTADGYTSYPMYFVPHDRRPSAFFCEPIVDQIDESAEKQVIMIFEFGYRQPFAHALIKYGQVEEVVFINKEAIE